LLHENQATNRRQTKYHRNVVIQIPPTSMTKFTRRFLITRTRALR
jgi:hypothetical protein